MCDRLCGCCMHLSVQSEKLASFYKDHFIPQGWKLAYSALSEGVILYLTGYCQNCYQELEERVLLEKSLTGDKLFSAIYDAMQTAHPYDKKTDTGLYYGSCKSRSDFYQIRDKRKTFRQDQEFLRLFHDYDRNAARRWLEEIHPDRAHTEVFRDTGGSLFCAVLELAKKNGDFEKAQTILDYVLPSENEAHSSESVELAAYEFDFVPIVNFGGSEGIYLDCYLKGKFDESGRSSLHIATLKTLEEGLEAAKIMAELGGALMYHASQYVNENIHRFTPQVWLNNQYQRMLEQEKSDGEKHGE